MPKFPEAGLTAAIEDTRTRNQAVLDLILFTDQQAGVLLTAYIAIGTAAGTGAIAGLTSDAVPPLVGYTLLGATTFLLAAAILCFLAMQSAKVALPGRHPDFWLWAIEHSDLQGAVVAYLQNLNDTIAVNDKVNAKTAVFHKWAKLFGATSPAAAVIFAAAARLFGLTS